jgi:hypothetical protein
MDALLSIWTSLGVALLLAGVAYWFTERDQQVKLQTLAIDLESANRILNEFIDGYESQYGPLLPHEKEDDLHGAHLTHQIIEVGGRAAGIENAGLAAFGALAAYHTMKLGIKVLGTTLSTSRAQRKLRKNIFEQRRVVAGIKSSISRAQQESTIAAISCGAVAFGFFRLIAAFF